MGIGLPVRWHQRQGLIICSWSCSCALSTNGWLGVNGSTSPRDRKASKLDLTSSHFVLHPRCHHCPTLLQICKGLMLIVRCLYVSVALPWKSWRPTSDVLWRSIIGLLHTISIGHQMITLGLTRINMSLTRTQLTRLVRSWRGKTDNWIERRVGGWVQYPRLPMVVQLTANEDDLSRQGKLHWTCLA